MFPTFYKVLDFKNSNIFESVLKVIANNIKYMSHANNNELSIIILGI